MRKKFDGTSSVKGEFNRNAGLPPKANSLHKITGYEVTSKAASVKRDSIDRVTKARKEDLGSKPSVHRPSGPGGPGKGAS